MALQGDYVFWPHALQVLDFSLRFKEIILEILPSGAFLLLGILVYLYYRRQPVYNRNGLLLLAKLVATNLFLTID